MTEQNIDLTSLKFFGHTLSETRNGILYMTVTHAWHTGHTRTGTHIIPHFRFYRDITQWFICGNAKENR